jgi:hypothetical protein
VYRDAVTRVSIAQLRAQFTPRAFRALPSVRLDVGGMVMDATLVDDAGAGFVKGTRRWFECPRCQRRVNVLGAVEGVGWVCPRCGGWRSRNRPRATVARLAEP